MFLAYLFYAIIGILGFLSACIVVPMIVESWGTSGGHKERVMQCNAIS